MNFTIFYFNSIKVQLERGVPGALVGGALFQFHKGTIRTIPIEGAKMIDIISIP